MIDGFSTYQKHIDNFNLGYWLGWDEGWPIPHGPVKNRAAKMVHGVIENVVNTHLAGGGEEGSMIDLLVKRRQRNPELGLMSRPCATRRATIFMAGTKPPPRP